MKTISDKTKIDKMELKNRFGITLVGDLYTGVNVKKGDKVFGFNGANDSVGTLKMRFDNEDIMMHFLDHVNEYVTISVH